MVLWLILISLLNVLSAVPMALRARHDFARLGHISLPVAIWTGAFMNVHAAVTFALAWLDRGSFSEPSLISMALGLVIASAGGGLIAAGRREYVSRARLYGLVEDKLIATGIYRYSRNPQYVGYWLVLLGAATASLSQWAFLLGFGIVPIIHFYVRGVEEPHLRSAFGQNYREYCSRTPRYLLFRG